MTPPPAPPAPPAPADAALTAKEVAEIRSSHTQLQALLTQLIARVDAQAPAPHALAPTTQVASSFVPPVIAPGVIGTSFTAPPSLRSRFPDIDATVLAAIVSHEFKAADLHKLDPTNRDKETAYTFNGSTNQFEVSNRMAREYKTPFSVLIPLQTYFRILAFHVNDAPATDPLWSYT